MESTTKHHLYQAYFRQEQCPKCLCTISLLIGWWMLYLLVKRSDPINNRFGLKRKWCYLLCGMRQGDELGTDTHPEFGWINGTICSPRTGAAWDATLEFILSLEQEELTSSVYLAIYLYILICPSAYLTEHIIYLSTNNLFYTFVYASTYLFMYPIHLYI
jgi:hypothetical protein